jgi:hypothetical protein
MNSGTNLGLPAFNSGLRANSIKKNGRKIDHVQVWPKYEANPSISEFSTTTPALY